MRAKSDEKTPSLIPILGGAEQNGGLVRITCMGIELRSKSGYPVAMKAKQKALRAVRSLASDASCEDAIERLRFLAKVERGLRQADAGRTISHSKVRQKMKSWLRSDGLSRLRTT